MLLYSEHLKVCSVDFVAVYVYSEHNRVCSVKSVAVQRALQSVLC